ncbi:MAG: ATP-binding protein [Thioalkalispiraceae bacterium]|jgi:signal transduction histidine kinase
MTIRQRLLITFCLLSLVGITLIITVIFSIWQDERVNEEFRRLSHIASLTLANTSPGELYNPQHDAIYWQSPDGALQPAIARKPVLDSALSLDYQPVTEKQFLDNGKASYVMVAIPVPGKAQRLVVISDGNKFSFNSFLAVYGVPVIVITIVSLWVAVWAALILSASFLRIEQQKQELEQQREDLEDARRQAEQASFAKSTFLANMSHELRTPLNAILGYCEILQEEAEDGKFSHAEKDLGKIHTAATHLLNLINGILDLSKIEAGKMVVNIEPVNMYQLLTEVLTIIKPMASKRGNQLVIDIENESLKIESDTIKLRQVIYNLLSNACKFTENGQILLSACTLNHEGEAYYQIVIRDEGIGMSLEQVEKIFNPFVQADDSISRIYGGTGLGLSITGRFVQMLGGSIKVHSKPGKGSTFTILLPLKQPAVTEQAASSSV